MTFGVSAVLVTTMLSVLVWSFPNLMMMANSTAGWSVLVEDLWKCATVAGLTLLSVSVGLFLIFRLLGIRKAFTQIGTGLLMSTVGFIVAWIHLRCVDPWYIRWGRVTRESSSDSGRAAVTLKE